ncbi:MAG TPA: VOC family protein, partial [Candidatus Thermoplasmatota archaeon]|nr:VOC family protein [Candidatus Thermoplasmatota archaeon]
VHDVHRAVAFYRDALGFRAGDVLDTPEFGWAEVEVARGVKLGLHADKGNAEEGARPPGGASGFYFVVPDVDKAVERLRGMGVKVVDEPADKPYGRDACIEDPDGNVLALMTP